MTHKFHTTVLCSLSVLLAACGSAGNDGAQAPKTALLASAQASTQVSIAFYYDVVEQLYFGYFGRPADADGLFNFATKLRDAGAPTDLKGINEAYNGVKDANGTIITPRNPAVVALIENFGSSAESAALYPGDNSVFVEAIYQNLFGRASDAEGKAYWLKAVNNGTLTRANAAINIMAGAQPADAAVVSKKTIAANLFTNGVTTGTGKLAYDGAAAAAIARTMLANVTQASEIGTLQATVNATLAAVTAARPVAGMYAGTYNTNSRINTLVLDDDSYYSFYSFNSAVPIVPLGMLYGSGKSSSGNFAAPVVHDYNNNVLFTLSGYYNAQVAFNGTLTASTGTLNFASSVIDSATYDYNKPAALADVAGSWNMVQTGVAAQAITILADGSFTGSSTGCAIAGKLTPRGNKNVFDATVSFGGNASATLTCPLATTTITGVAFTYSLNAGVTRQLYIAATTPGDHALGALMIGTNALVAGQPTALAITDTLIGTGAVVSAGKTITVKYIGYLYDPSSTNLRGAIFDSSDYHSPNTFSFALGTGQVIAGWDQGFNGMRVSGKRTLVIPSSLAYGATGNGSIPANAGLVFDVELISSN